MPRETINKPTLKEVKDLVDELVHLHVDKTSRVQNHIINKSSLLCFRFINYAPADCDFGVAHVYIFASVGQVNQSVNFDIALSSKKTCCF